MCDTLENVAVLWSFLLEVSVIISDEALHMRQLVSEVVENLSLLRGKLCDFLRTGWQIFLSCCVEGNGTLGTYYKVLGKVL